VRTRGGGWRGGERFAEKMKILVQPSRPDAPQKPNKEKKDNCAGLTCVDAPETGNTQVMPRSFTAAASLRMSAPPRSSPGASSAGTRSWWRETASSTSALTRGGATQKKGEGLLFNRW
jgi:hypothetical protein